MNALSIEPESAGSDALGKQVSELQDSIVISGKKITGTLHYVKSYTGFSQDTSEQNGNYLVFKVNAPADATVKFKIIGGKSGEKTLPADDHQVILKIAATTQKPWFSITYKGETGSVEFDLSGLKLETDDAAA